MSDKDGVTRGPIINLADVPLEGMTQGTRFAAQMGQLNGLIGMDKLGARLHVVQAGKRAWPMHNHYANEELAIVLEGSGTLRYGDDERDIGKGDVISMGIGGPETAHQIVNSSDGDLTYLVISTMIEPEVVEYPDSGKFGALAGMAPGGPPENRKFTGFAPLDARVGYWDGEEID